MLMLTVFLVVVQVLVLLVFHAKAQAATPIVRRCEIH